MYLADAQPASARSIYSRILNEMPRNGRHILERTTETKTGLRPWRVDARNTGWLSKNSSRGTVKLHRCPVSEAVECPFGMLAILLHQCLQLEREGSFAYEHWGFAVLPVLRGHCRLSHVSLARPSLSAFGSAPIAFSIQGVRLKIDVDRH